MTEVRRCEDSRAKGQGQVHGDRWALWLLLIDSPMRCVF